MGNYDLLIFFSRELLFVSLRSCCCCTTGDNSIHFNCVLMDCVYDFDCEFVVNCGGDLTSFWICGIDLDLNLFNWHFINEQIT